MSIWASAEPDLEERIARRLRVLTRTGNEMMAATRLRPSSDPPTDHPGPPPSLPAVDDADAAVTIEELCRDLRLPTIRARHSTALREATREGWSYERIVLELLTAERDARRERGVQRRLREARFPARKTLEELDWEALEGVTQAEVAELASGEYLARGNDVVIAGPTGTGKTHLAIGLGVEAARQGRRVTFRRAAELADELREAGALSRVREHYQRVPLLILDELTLTPLDGYGCDLLVHLLDARHERQPTIVTTHLAFEEWTLAFGEHAAGSAFVDRLRHHAHVLTTRGRSYRERRAAAPPLG